ncbi:hypothetical protein [uncultured Ruminococcus sp.]|uniref:hypothetical protein n=1 Tax=uncultured Ruminococcus sp. TaxID=165186 RepID=UPI0025F8A8B3|nr:hypothetical protein [uncultured Ruminococcus sp.]
MRTFIRRTTAFASAFIVFICSIFLYGLPFAASAEGNNIKMPVRSYRLVCRESPGADGWWGTTYDLSDLMDNALLGGKWLEDAQIDYYDDGTFVLRQPETHYDNGNIGMPSFTVRGSYFNTDNQCRYENSVFHYGESYSPTTFDFGIQRSGSGAAGAADNLSYSQSIKIESANVLSAREVTEFKFDPTDIREMFHWDMRDGFIYIDIKGKINISNSTNTEAQHNLTDKGVMVHICYQVQDVEESSLGMGWMYDLLDPRNWVKENKVIHTEADPEAGEDEGQNVSTKIVEGVTKAAEAGAAAGSVGAVASALQAQKAEDEKNKKSYKMKIYKDFGDTLRKGEVRIVYAKMVEVYNGKSADRADLSQNIQIYAGNTAVIVTPMGMSGEWQAAKVQLDDTQSMPEAVVAFRFGGKGGSFTNNVHFKTLEPKIVFYQENLALPALYEDEEPLQFTVEGFGHGQYELDVTITDGSYNVRHIESENVPDTYFALIKDINKKTGEAGTYETYTLTVRAYDDDLEVKGELTVYRVTTGLYIAANAINCYRVPREGAVPVETDLGKTYALEDYRTALTTCKAWLLIYDEKKHCMFQSSVTPAISFEPLNDDATVASYINTLGIGMVVTKREAGMSECTFYCAKGFLNPPTRVKVKLKAAVKYKNEDGEHTYECEREVLLRSQPIKQFATIEENHAFYKQMQEYSKKLDTMIEQIEKNNFLDILKGEYAMAIMHRDAYMECSDYGYDVQMVEMLLKCYKAFQEQRQTYLEQMQSLAHDRASGWWPYAAVFANISENVLDTWPGIIARIALGVCTSGLSEAVFLPMDVNKAINKYRDATPPEKRTDMAQFTAGAIPVAIAVTFYGVGKVVGKVAGKVLPKVPGAAKAVGGWVYKNLPTKAQAMTDSMGKIISQGAEKVKNFIPTKFFRKMLGASQNGEASAAAGKNAANRAIMAERMGAQEAETTLMILAEDAGGLEAAGIVKNFKNIVDKHIQGLASEAEVKQAILKIMKNEYALEQLNNFNKGLPDAYRKIFNAIQSKSIYGPALNDAKLAVATRLGVDPSRITFGNISSNGKKALKEGLKIGHDLDVTFYLDGKMIPQSQLTQKEAAAIYYRYFCEHNGLQFTTTSEATACAELYQQHVCQNATDREFIHEVGKLLGLAEDGTVNPEMIKRAFSTPEVTNKVAGTLQYKMLHSFMQGERMCASLTAAEKQAAAAEFTRFLNREVTELSNLAQRYIKGVALQKEGVRQGTKSFQQIFDKWIASVQNGGTEVLGQELYTINEASKMTVSQGVKSVTKNVPKSGGGTIAITTTEGNPHAYLGEYKKALGNFGTSYEEYTSKLTGKLSGINRGLENAPH